MDVLKQIEQCPVCSQELEEGIFTRSGHANAWQTDSKLFFSEDREIILPLSFAPKKNMIKAKRCTNCRFVLLPY